LKYDNVMNDQRKVIFEQRIGLMRGEDISETIDDMRHDTVTDAVTKHIPPDAYAENWDAPGLREQLRKSVGIDFPVDEWAKEEGIADEEILERITTSVEEIYAEKREKYGKDIMQQVEKAVLLQTLDRQWREHIVTVDYLRQVIHLRGYGQRDPLNEYKTEAFNLFSGLLVTLKEAVTSQMMRVEIQTRPADDMLPDEDELPATTGEDDVGEGGFALAVAPPAAKARGKAKAKGKTKEAAVPVVGRNEPCPCGSGKRYKHCHGAYV
jgi:preprotein translocase subunit SecA